jgi:hypothetical protein
MGQDGQVGKSETADVTPADAAPATSTFESLLARDVRNERRILWSELGVTVFVALLIVAFLLFA